jgi:hypothetical protein
MGERNMEIVDKQPVFIAGSPRSGTTMLAGLLVKHGFWVGESRVTKDPSSNSLIATENLPIKRSMLRQLDTLGYKNRQIPFPTPQEMGLLDYDSIWAEVQRVLPDNQKWLLKTAGLLLFYEFWNEKFPDARWIFPRRNVQDIVDSIKRHKYMKLSLDTKEFVESALERQLVVEKHVANSMYVPVKLVANLDMVLIKKYFDFCGVEMDVDIVYDFIDPKMMH